MSKTVTTDQLADLIRPFVGAQRNRGPRTASLEIVAPGQRFGNADVRSLDRGEVEVFFYRGCETVPLANIRSVVIRGLDARGRFTSETTYEHVGQAARVAA
jgi:hypothetical protein